MQQTLYNEGQRISKPRDKKKTESTEQERQF